MTVGPRWTPQFRELIQDPNVVEEFDRLAAVLNAALSGQTTLDAEAGLDNGQTVNTRPIADSGAADNAIRWLKGPWLLNSDGDVAGQAVIRPPQITSNQDNYAPTGIDTAIGLELTSDADRTITGFRIAAQQRRLLFVLNKGSFNIRFPHDDSGSIAEQRFGLGTTGEFLNLTPGRLVWFFYDVAGKFWRLFALPALAPGDLPNSIANSFPIDNDWFGSRTVNSGAGATTVGIGEQAPTFGGSSFAADNQTTGMFEQCNTSGAAGSGAGVTSGGSNQLRVNQDPTWTVIIKTGTSIAAVRFWILFSDTANSDADDQGGVSSYVGWRYSTVASDPGWVGVSRDGATQSVTGSVGSIAVSTVYKLRIRKSGSTVYFSVNDGAEVSKTSNLPAATTDLKWFANVWAQAAAVKSISWSRHMVKFGVTP